jgi:hypothetical protein
MFTLNIDGNKFEFDNYNGLTLNSIKYEGDSDFLETLHTATQENDFDESQFYDNYDIVNLDNLNNVIHKFNIFEMDRGSCFIKSYWGRDSVLDVKKSLHDTKPDNGLNYNASIKDHLNHYIDRNYKLFTKIELYDFIINRKDIDCLYHSSVINAINKL